MLSSNFWNYKKKKEKYCTQLLKMIKIKAKIIIDAVETEQKSFSLFKSSFLSLLFQFLRLIPGLEMPTKCSVPDCGEFSSKKCPFSFHRFPSSKYLSKKWLRALKLKGNFKLSAARVCSKHFSPQQYKQNGSYVQLCLYVTLLLSVHKLCG